MDLKWIPTYFDEDDKRKISFLPLSGDECIPGFTHRVVINTRRVDYLAKEYHPSYKTARYFLEKHPKITIHESEKMFCSQKTTNELS